MLKMTAILLVSMIGFSAVFYMLESLVVYIKNFIVDRYNNKREKERLKREEDIKRRIKERKQKQREQQ